jgi:DNA polymerase III subunit epsilon
VVKKAKHDLAQVVFCIVDLETTGASASGGSSITEIGAIKVRGGEVLGEFSTFVNPLSPLPGYITELTGITDEMLKDAPIINEIFNDFLTFIEAGVGRDEKIVIVAHNAPFDLSFLKAAADVLETPWPNYPVLDTVKLARKTVAKDEVGNYKLGSLAYYFQTKVAPTHRALDDVKTTVEILHRLIERLGSFEVKTWQELESFLKR